MRVLRGFGRFWYDFLVGDDWKIAVAVATVLLVGAGFVVAGGYDAPVLTALLGLGVGTAFVVALLLDVRSSGR
ncbi:MAG TPA: hypothetical protein VHW64_08595 [Nocardioides sp.]|jgi:hypothetical protein|uniref:hypothetical protein n=1 Tax=Nocardioides sp. TaxID=35761 RepID=UPI002E31C211|nr:hypothetical protein [Nocardioides sp.]HEX3930749.1 hypothetical protein [Nocardioides sp.]